VGARGGRFRRGRGIHGEPRTARGIADLWRQLGAAAGGPELRVHALAARVTLFDRRSGSWPRNYPFHYRLLDDRGEELLRGTSDLSLSRSGEPVLIRPTNRDLFIGAYTIEVELVDGKSRWKIAREFEVEESGPPQGREFERMLEPLAYVADAREIDVLRALPLEEQTRGWEEFWKRRDPTPETVRNEAMIEFLRRVSYADRHFQGFGPGWRSDMGRIYIKNGAPEQTETRSASAETAQLEIWYYSQPYRRYVFADREGFGRFVLVSPVGE
jgi:GWxTD domain-containing protein